MHGLNTDSTDSTVKHGPARTSTDQHGLARTWHGRHGRTDSTDGTTARTARPHGQHGRHDGTDGTTARTLARTARTTRPACPYCVRGVYKIQIPAGGEVFSLLAMVISAMGAAAAKALASEVTDIPIVVVWACVSKLGAEAVQVTSLSFSAF